MKRFLNIVLLLIPGFVFAAGTGEVLDITIRTEDKLLVVKVSNPGPQPACVSWYHSYALKMEDDPLVGGTIYSMLMSAQQNHTPVRITGKGTCISGWQGTEEISEVNIGGWQG